jgi:hypothetical protein
MTAWSLQLIIKKVILQNSMDKNFKVEMDSKVYSWDKGIITGTGEAHVIHRSIELFKKLAQSDIRKLPDCLKISRQMRELEIGTNHFQVENTKYCVQVTVKMVLNFIKLNDLIHS